MTYETTCYFTNNKDEKNRETISIVIHENTTWVYHFVYDELFRKTTNEDTMRTFDKAHQLNAQIYFDNLVDSAKHTYKYHYLQTSVTYDEVENF